MTVMAQEAPGMGRGSRQGSLYDTIELILDKGIVIDAFVRLSLIGIELIKLEVRVVIASVDTFLRYAETISRLEYQRATPDPLTRLVPPPAIERGAAVMPDGLITKVPAQSKMEK
ncbi:MAG TPA: gas vesicle protein GvpJ [Candidatus Limnocylindrales bacterium]